MTDIFASVLPVTIPPTISCTSSVLNWVLSELIVNLLALSLVTVTLVPPDISTSSVVESEPVNLILVVEFGTFRS